MIFNFEISKFPTFAAMQPQRFFLLIASIFGFVFVFIVPPFQSPDEFNHFYRSWQISEIGNDPALDSGAWSGITGKKTADNRLGDSLPISLLNISSPFAQLPFHFEQHIKSNTIFSNLKTPLEAQQKTFIDFTNTAVYAPTAYLSQSISIFLLKKWHFTPLSIFYLARLFTLIFWITIVYASIKISPIHRWLFTFLALLPSSLFINASLNADVITNALSFLSISLFVKMFFEKNKISKTEILTFLFSTALISLNKIAYLPICFLVFLIPKEKFDSPRQKLFFSFLVLTTNIAVVVWWAKMIAPLYIRFEDYNPTYRIGQQLNPGVDPSAQLAFIVHNPLIFIKIMMTSFVKTMPHTLIHYVGKFGWGKNYLPLVLILPLFLMLILMPRPESIVMGRDSENLTTQIFSKATKFMIFAIGLLMSASLATAMYLLWCPVGSNFIDNLSGKYFIPIFPLFFLALPSIDLKKYRFFTTEKWIAVWLCLTLCYSVWQVCTRYYVAN